ncbi:hypothetical protein KAX97_04720 [candidate division WOR-3 bacterium]|nr:hypothetical protein [candidate division WOR-3 bacterium]
MGLPDSLWLIVMFTIVFLLVGTVIICKLLYYMPFANLYYKLHSHYDICPIFTKPPPTYESYDGINDAYGNGRINALISEYIMLGIVVFFILFSIIGYLSYGIFDSWIEATIGLSINSVVSEEVFRFVTSTPIEGFGFLILAPQLVMSPYTDYVLMVVLFSRKKTPPLNGDANIKSLTDYLSFETIGNNFVYGTTFVVAFYLSAKIISMLIFGKTFVFSHNIYITSACIAFSITFLLACRSITLSEMFKDTQTSIQ